MDSIDVEETVSRVTTFIPRWDATLVWNIEEFETRWSWYPSLDSGKTEIANTALKKNLSWQIRVSKNHADEENATLLLYLYEVYFRYCTYEILLGEPGASAYVTEKGKDSLDFANHVHSRATCACIVYRQGAQRIEPQFAQRSERYENPFYRYYECNIPIALMFRQRSSKSPQGALRITVKLTIVFEAENKAGIRELPCIEDSAASQETWIKSLFNNEMYSDVTIRCNEDTFFGHKNVLGRSSVFARMFSTPMKEALSNEVIISDVDPDILGCFLKSMYGQPLELPEDVSGLVELINLAEKYDIMATKLACFKKLVTMISDENAAELNVVAYRFCNNEKMKGFRDFFKNYCLQRHKILANNPGYKELFSKNIDAFI